MIPTPSTTRKVSLSSFIPQERRQGDFLLPACTNPIGWGTTARRKPRQFTRFGYSIRLNSKSMPTLRVKFDQDNNRAIALRTASAVREGDFLDIRGEIFQVGRDRQVFKILKQPPQVFKVEDVASAHPAPESVAAPEPSRPAPSVQVGQAWASKDPRRPGRPFKIVRVGEGTVETDLGTTIKFDRLKRYRLIEAVA